MNNKTIVELNLSDVLPNRFQPRIKFDENSILELSESIKKYGVIQPIVVRKIADKYEIIAGERRYKASVLAGKQTIPAIVTDFSDSQSVEIALLENIQREDLTPIEKAIAYKKIIDMGYMKQEDLASKIGKKQSTISNTLRLLSLTEDVQEALLENKISERHARSLLRVKEPNKQVDMLNRIINERLTVRRTDEEIEKMENNIPEQVQPSIIEEINPTTNVSNPGFVDVEKIETEAKDIYQEEPKKDIDSLLKPDSNFEPIKNDSIEKEEELLQPHNFFNFFSDDKQEEDTLYDMPVNIVDDVSVIPDVVEIPAVEEPQVPTFEMPTVEEPQVPTFEVPTVEEPQIPTFEVPTVEEPQVPTFEMPTVEEPQVPTFEMPAVEEPQVPTFEVPTVEEPQVPTFEMPAVEEPQVPTFEVPTVEEPQVLTFEVPTVEEPQVPTFEVPTVEEPQVPTFEVPTVEEPQVPTFEVPIKLNTEINNDVLKTTTSKNIRPAINMIRDCSNEIEKLGFEIDVEEIDFEDSYQVIFKIQK